VIALHSIWSIRRTKLGQSFPSLEEIRGTTLGDVIAYVVSLGWMTSSLAEAHNGPTVA